MWSVLVYFSEETTAMISSFESGSLQSFCLQQRDDKGIRVWFDVINYRKGRSPDRKKKDKMTDLWIAPRLWLPSTSNWTFNFSTASQMASFGSPTSVSVSAVTCSLTRTFELAEFHA